MGVVLAVIGAPFVAAWTAFAAGRRVPTVVVPAVVIGTLVSFGLTLMLVGAVVVGEMSTRASAWVTVPTGGPPFELAIRVDGLSVLVGLLVVAVALAVQVYSIDYLRDDPRYPSYAALVSLFTAAMLLVVFADDLLVLLVGWEVMGICSYFLISHHWELSEARSGAIKAFLQTHIGDIAFLFGIFVLALHADTFRISGIQRLAGSGELSGGTVTLATLLILGGVVGKSAQFPLHSWLPDAMAGPTPISALIHAATMVAAGVFLVARLSEVFWLAPATLMVLGVIAAITMVTSALTALVQTDLKRVLAWSTVSQLAFMLGGLAVGGYEGSLLHLLVHGAFKALLFLCAGAVIHAVGSNLLAAMGGLRRVLPVTFWTMTVGLAALAGLPPISGFLSKDAILTAAQDAALHGGTGSAVTAWIVLGAGLVTVVLTAAYATRIWLCVFFGSAPARAPRPHEAPALMRWPLRVLAVPTILVGYAAFAPQGLGRTLVGAAPGASPPASQPELLHLSTVVFAVLAAGLSAAAVIGEWHRVAKTDPTATLARKAPVVAREFDVDRIYDVLVVRPVLLLARGVRAGDRDVVDAYVSGAGRGARLLGGLLRRAQNGHVQAYLTVLTIGVVLLVVAAGGAAS